MQTPRHDILGGTSSGMSQRRMMIIGSVAMLHVLIVYALVSGMAQKIMQIIPPDLKVRILETNTDTKNVPPPPKPTMVQPQVTQNTMPPPDITIASTQQPPITVQPTPPQPPAATTPDTTATGLAYTHTTPPYPEMARKLTEQGTVTLQMTISAQGEVTSATVLQSSGFADLDQAAVSWVQRHWRYKPAMQNGQAVPSQAQAAVKFDLKTARG
jgi:periplasmic protein TonB